MPTNNPEVTSELLFSATTFLDFQAQLRNLDLFVSPQREGRTTRQGERFSIAHLLYSLPTEKLFFPLSVVHADRPDFVLNGKELSIGVELIEAVPENWAKAEYLREKGHGPAIYFIPHANPVEPKTEEQKLIKQIEENSPGIGWAGDEAEHAWAKAMIHSALKKVKVAQKTGFDRYHLNWLFIYDNWPLPGLERSKAASLLSAMLLCKEVFSTFDHVFTVGDRSIVQFNGEIKSYPCQDPKHRKSI